MAHFLAARFPIMLALNKVGEGGGDLLAPSCWELSSCLCKSHIYEALIEFEDRADREGVVALRVMHNAIAYSLVCVV